MNPDAITVVSGIVLLVGIVLVRARFRRRSTDASMGARDDIE